jgi:hypothetical protein
MVSSSLLVGLLVGRAGLAIFVVGSAGQMAGLTDPYILWPDHH